MGGEWRSSTWGNEVSLEYGKALHGYDDARGRYRVFGSNGPIGWTSQPLVQGPGVILGRKGAYRGVQYSTEPFHVIDTAYYVVPKSEMDMRWLYYAIIHHKLGEVDDGSPIPSTTRSAVYVMDIDVPPLPIQHAIADILGSLDDKIELNRRTNETLEAMARAVFKSWFVDFDPVVAKSKGRQPEGMDAETAKLFPCSFQNSELGLIPTGWTIARMGDVAERIAMGPFGSSIKVDTFGPEGIPVISGQHLWGLHLEDGHYNFVTYEHAERLKNANVYRGDVVFTHAGSIGQAAYIPETSEYSRYIISQRQFYLRCNPRFVSPLFIVHYFRTQKGRHRLLANTSSTGVPSISRPVSYLRTIDFVLPNKELVDAFDRTIHPLETDTIGNEQESKTISEVRDALLPRLLSGELTVPALRVA